ncbi:PREDICTED: uncharacterized protein LOC108969603 [Bactrocera latifrons]|uniref:uncharacterized protein LOC108969603 n=1 Tax=Bactrocera latifrons TaxID=174628 RepID=UPI0008DE73FB|nr:PREDICTED: uncharacterized protein LOC108969603 [Bactrocera latifrons]
MRLAFLLILLHGQTLKLVVECIPSTDCGDVSDCVPESQNAICALDREIVCFKYFYSLCHLKYEECQDQREYAVYSQAYCENSAFMCGT